MAKQCRWLGVSTSGYYDWLRRQEKPCSKRVHRAIVDEAEKIAFEKRRHRYGSPRLTLDLCEAGFPLAENTVAASMRRQGLIAKAGRKYKATTNSNHGLPVARNLLEQDFSCTSVNQKLCGDITYLWTDEGWLYLAVVIDLFSRRVVGWSMNHKMTRQLVCDAMKMAIDTRGDLTSAIMHTDRGSQYCSRQFQQLLKAYGIRSSMSKRGDCFDNACAESFFHSLKVEAIHGEKFSTRESMRETVFEYIELDYNSKRHHSAINNTNPVDFERQNAA